MDQARDWIAGFFAGRWDWFTGLISKPLGDITLLDLGGLALTAMLAYAALVLVVAIASSD